MPHHAGCWEENGGCATFGCSGKLQQDVQPAPAESSLEESVSAEEAPDDTAPAEAPPAGTPEVEVCAGCGAPLGPTFSFCPNCGTPKNTPKKRFCQKCGAPLEEGKAFCSSCGNKVDLQVDAQVRSAISQFNANIQKKSLLKNKKALIGVGLGVITLVVILVLALGGGKENSNDRNRNFRQMYGDLEKNNWCTIASDGSYMMIDTNPNDIDSDYAYTIYSSTTLPANNAIERINKELGFSDALMAKMNTTTWSMGRQTDSNSKYTVSWTYHPDKGLEVMYEMKNRK